MAAHHYVSKFHLRQFCDPSSLNSPDPWIWVGTIEDGSVKRRAPQNVGTASGLFEGPGGFADESVTIERFLANEVEGPAARALHQMTTASHITTLPSELFRYLAWAAARALPMQVLDAKWALHVRGRPDEKLAEPPPEGIANTPPRNRPVRLVHPVLGAVTLNATEDVGLHIEAGWIPDPTDRDNFLEGAHIQAYYFQVRWFPRLKWFTLRPPTGGSFILGDRPIGWGVPEDLEAPPSCLRDPSAFLIAPLTPHLALVARNDATSWSITPSQVNAILVAWAHEWIVGPSKDEVAAALRDRRRLADPPDAPRHPFSGRG
jgi:hypothetical protein